MLYYGNTVQECKDTPSHAVLLSLCAPCDNTEFDLKWCFEISLSYFLSTQEFELCKRKDPLLNEGIKGTRGLLGELHQGLCQKEQSK